MWELHVFSLVVVGLWKENNIDKRRIPTYLLENLLTLNIKYLKISIEQGTMVTTLDIIKH
jgi:hypothetical protein